MAFSFTCSTTRLITLPVGREEFEEEEAEGRDPAVELVVPVLALLRFGVAKELEAVERFAGDRLAAGRAAARAGAALRAAGRRFALLRAAWELLRAPERFAVALPVVRLAEAFLAPARFAAGRRAAVFFDEDFRAGARFFEDFDDDFREAADFVLFEDLEAFFDDLRPEDFFDDDFLDVFLEAAIRVLLFKTWSRRRGFSATARCCVAAALHEVECRPTCRECHA